MSACLEFSTQGAQTCRILLETAIRCLHRRGYAATTTLLVAGEAGLSRGGLLHHFPIRVDLMMPRQERE